MTSIYNAMNSSVSKLVLVLATYSVLLAQSPQKVSFVTVEDDSDLITIIESETSDPFSKEAKISFKLDDSVQVRVQITTILGEPVRELLSAELDTGMHILTWDGKDDNGRPITSGVFTCEIQAKKTRRSATLALLY